MKKSVHAPSSRSLRGFFHRFHTTMFILLVLGGLVYATMSLASLLNDASIGGDYQSPITAGSIDQSTLDRINALHTSDGVLPTEQPQTGRSNPFIE